MSTTLETVAVATPPRMRPWHRTSARLLADQAVRKAVADAGLTTGDIELMVNAGIYHERNLGEPALAALIQQDVGAHPEDPHAGEHGTFSFDIANGACGPLTGLQIADGFLRARAIDRALVVAGDGSPGRRLAPGFPFEAAGAAVVCMWNEDAAGLAGFRWRTYPEFSSLFQSRVIFDGGRNTLRIDQDPEFADRAAACAAEVSAGLLGDADMKPGDVDLVVANPLGDAFLGPLSQRLGVPGERFVSVPGGDRIHTAGLFAALAEAERAGRMTTAERVLLVSAGAGLVAGAALLCS
ncbi:hypothetical protein J4573_49485 [Actinomadura barringtoniae]|uniref:Beta-ketoacyl-[acyl-carrier-protein] synthase III C-terminal domain-containing protein n=1 Tax=Actinomadura barringtoniae TaxID=1427535 RepID=A0A939TD40_9ACTN|nr:3-oxoacyl-[acyl-carrier-protein] synthase III C-terminal domain-containing protein [Actinomadura barringtoniae]MBO2455197.1 hypothetical protein [Actinomadura barringtoniae]